jgi:hypothetical protein
LEAIGLLGGCSDIDSQRNVLGGYMEILTDLERDCLARAIRHIIGSKDKVESDELSETARGAGGYGSTGK